MRALALVPFLFVAAGCWQARHFTPREHVGGTGPRGQPAALYGLADAQGGAAGELRVWSTGAAATFTDDDREVVELGIGFELENNGREPLRLDPASVVCEALVLDGVAQPPLVPVRVTGDGVAAPGTTARVDAVFEPATTVPRDVDEFAVRFAVRTGPDVGANGGADVLLQSTPFAPWVRQYPEDRAWVAPWSFGFGFGLGWHHHCW
jgi:hypothetical protein